MDKNNIHPPSKLLPWFCRRNLCLLLGSLCIFTHSFLFGTTLPPVFNLPIVSPLFLYKAFTLKIIPTLLFSFSMLPFLYSPVSDISDIRLSNSSSSDKSSNMPPLLTMFRCRWGGFHWWRQGKFCYSFGGKTFIGDGVGYLMAKIWCMMQLWSLRRLALDNSVPLILDNISACSCFFASNATSISVIWRETDT